MSDRAFLAVVLLAGALVMAISPGPAHAMTDSWAELAPVSGTSNDHSTTMTPTPDHTEVLTSGGDENPPAVPNPGPPTEISPQSALPATGGPSWVFAALGISLMLTGTVLTVTARRAGRRRG